MSHGISHNIISVKNQLNNDVHTPPSDIYTAVDQLYPAFFALWSDHVCACQPTKANNLLSRSSSFCMLVLQFMVENVSHDYVSGATEYPDG